MSQKDSAENDPVLQWVTCQLEDEVYGINVMQVQEVLRLTEIAPVPGAPDYVIGIINLRGNVVTVIDTRRRFGLGPTENDDSSRIIIIEVNGNVIGMLVDSVAEVVYLHQSEIDTAPSVNSDDSSRFIQGVCSREEQLLILIDVNKLLTEEEISDSSTFQIFAEMADDIRPTQPTAPSLPVIPPPEDKRREKQKKRQQEETEHEHDNDDEPHTPPHNGLFDEYV